MFMAQHKNLCEVEWSSRKLQVIQVFMSFYIPEVQLTDFIIFWLNG